MYCVHHSVRNGPASVSPHSVRSSSAACAFPQHKRLGYDRMNLGNRKGSLDRLGKSLAGKNRFREFRADGPFDIIAMNIITADLGNLREDVASSATVGGASSDGTGSVRDCQTWPQRNVVNA